MGYVSIKCSLIIDMFHHFPLMCDLKRCGVAWHSLLYTQVHLSLIVFPRQNIIIDPCLLLTFNVILSIAFSYIRIVGIVIPQFSLLFFNFSSISCLNHLHVWLSSYLIRSFVLTFHSSHFASFNHVFFFHLNVTSVISAETTNTTHHKTVSTTIFNLHLVNNHTHKTNILTQ